VQDVIINRDQGNALNLVVAPHSDALSELQTAMKAANFTIFGIAQSRPSLDDVYLSATGRTLLDADMAAASQRDLKTERKQSMR
ncbi:MAG TPA: lysozyme, partial [Stenomitos sp.]